MSSDHRKLTFALLAVASLSVGLAACGGAGKGTVSASRATSGAGARRTPVAALPQIEVKSDADSDSDTYENEPDNENELFGRANADDARSIAVLVKRYYAAAVARDGTVACQLLYTVLAETVPGSYGSAPTPPGPHQRQCAAVMSKLFGDLHKQMSAEGARLRVVSVRVRLNHGAAQFGSGGKQPFHYIMAHRERGAWKIDMLLAKEQPIRME